MIGIAGLVVCAALGADYGWEPSADGKSLEYIIQINPDLLQSLQEGDEIRREIPPEAAGVTCFRVKVGDGELPRHTVRNNPNVPMRAQPAGYDDHNPAGNRPVLGRQNQPNFSNGPIGVDYNGPIGPPSPYSNYGNSLTQNPSSFGTPTQQQQQHQPQYHYDSNSLTQNQNHDPLFDRFGSQSNFLSVPPNPNNLLASAPRTTNPATQYRGVSTNPAQPTTGFGATTRYASDAEKPWWPLLATSIALFISLGGNAYLGWVAAEFYTRYRDTVERMRAERRY